MAHACIINQAGSSPLLSVQLQVTGGGKVHWRAIKSSDLEHNRRCPN